MSVCLPPVPKADLVPLRRAVRKLFRSKEGFWRRRTLTKIFSLRKTRRRLECAFQKPALVAW